MVCVDEPKMQNGYVGLLLAPGMVLPDDFFGGHLVEHVSDQLCGRHGLAGGIQAGLAIPVRKHGEEPPTCGAGLKVLKHLSRVVHVQAFW